MRAVGLRRDRDVIRITRFLARNGYPLTLLEAGTPEGDRITAQQAGALPIVHMPDGQAFHNPTTPDLSDLPGLTEELDAQHLHDLAVIGAGPAGLSACVYGASEALDTPPARPRCSCRTTRPLPTSSCPATGSRPACRTTPCSASSGRARSVTAPPHPDATAGALRFQGSGRCPKTLPRTSGKMRSLAPGGRDAGRPCHGMSRHRTRERSASAGTTR